MDWRELQKIRDYEVPTPPHCDSAVLHAPGECVYCDACPAWQDYRVIVGIAFTGHEPTKGQIYCPSTYERSVEVINLWPGNRPQPKGEEGSSHG